MATKKCPVCDWTIKDDGKTITVCCDDCVTNVHANPENYLNPQ